MINLLNNIGRYINIISEYFCIIIMFIMTFIVILQIILRYLFSFCFPWSEVSVRYMMIWGTLIASAIILQKEEHFRLTIFIERIQEKYSKIINLIFHFLMLLFVIILFIEGLKAAIFGLEMYTASLGISFFIPYLSIPVMCAFMILHLINFIIRDIQKLLKPA
ncbi:MAG: TRAP transporter small permease [Spirochaetota bacterium]|nr:TRAP transporter small permease [Spirochaetota bacterium]